MRALSWIALAALALVPYLGSIHAPLLHDDRTLLDNRWLVTEAGPVSVFTHDYWFGTKHESSDLYRPLTVLSLAWNLRATPSKEGMRAVGIGLHALATLAVAWMIGAIAGRSAGWIGAALFAVHPLGSEAVLWAVGRAEILAALCGTIAFVQFMEAVKHEERRATRLGISLASFFAALCFKESAAAWLVIGATWLALYPASRRVTVTLALPYLGAFVAFYALRGSVVGWGRHAPPFVDNPLVDVGVATRAINALLLFARYAGKMIWPRTLSIEYGYDQIPVVPAASWGALAAIAIAASLIAAIVLLRRRGRGDAAFLVAFVPCAFAATGNLAFPIGTIFAERLAYTPLIGFCGLAGLGLAAIPKAGWRVGAVSVLLAITALRTFARGNDYRDLATLSAATASASPRAVKALYNDARSRLRQGHPAEAIPLLGQAVTIWPDYTRARQLLEQARGGAGLPQPGDDDAR